MKGLDLITFITVLVLLALYSCQTLFAVLNASRKIDGQPSILYRLFMSVPAATKTWTTVGIVLFLPVSISWLSSVSDILLKIHLGAALYSGCQSTLLVLITLEISQINKLNDRNREDWRHLLLLALVLDLISLVVLVSMIKILANVNGYTEWSLAIPNIVIIGFSAIFSSFLVVLFSQKAGE